MATKGIEITSSIPDEGKVPGDNITKVFTTIKGFSVNVNPDKSVTIEIFPSYHRTVAGYDGGAKQVGGWDSLKGSYVIEITEAQAESVFNTLYTKLKAAMVADHTTLTTITK